MMIGEVEDQQIHSFKKYRSSIRLGSDVFNGGCISEVNLQKAEDTFVHFAHLNKKFDVQRCRAVATSATREAKNQSEFISRLEKVSKIKIEVISGHEEAKMIFEAVRHEIPLENKQAVLIDVGGGSVEVTLTGNGKTVASQSYPWGTVRLLQELAKKNMNESQLKVVLGDVLNPLNTFVLNHAAGTTFDFAIGTGGNLECMARLKLDLLKKTPNTYCTLEELVEICDRLKSVSLKDRVLKLKLRPDRVDVIIPALLIVKAIMRQTSTQKILIPRVGLRDGLLLSMISVKK